MGCCGKGRAALRARRAGGGLTFAAPVAPTREHVPPGELRLEPVGGGSVSVRGSVTGRQYDFGPAQPPLDVHPSDALTLLLSGAFRVAS